MVEKFHENLKGLKDDVLEMGYLAEEMLRKAVEALVKQDNGLAEEVHSRKDRLRELDADIEDRALHLIALYQPVAKDLRTIACMLKMITYITRIGRYGKDVAGIELDLDDREVCQCLSSIPRMGELVCSMIKDSLKAFETEDLGLISNFESRDDTVDQMRYDIFRESVELMRGGHENIHECASYAMAARYLERCADHACKIAEKVHYMVSGEHAEIR